MTRFQFDFDAQAIELSHPADLLLSKYRNIGPAAIRAALSCTARKKNFYPK